MTTLEEKRRLAWEELIDYAKERTTKRPNEFTIKEYSDKTGCSYEVSKRLLRELEATNKIKSRIIGLNGTKVKVYELILSND